MSLLINDSSFRPVKSLFELRALCGINQDTLTHLRANLGGYYYIDFEPKLDRAGRQRIDRKGIPQFRKLTPSKGLLKEVQRRLNDYFQEYPFPSCVHGSVRGRDYVTNAAAHLGSHSFFCTDIKKFFPSISWERVYRIMIWLGHPAFIAQVIADLTTITNCLPQGAPTSPIISNLVMLHTDANIMEYALINKLIYTRYIDDIILSSLRCVSHEDACYIIRQLSRGGFKLSKNKTYIRNGSIEATGVRIHDGRMCAPKRQWDKLQDIDREEYSKKGIRSAMERIKSFN